jgi:pyruvate/2-oxoglutarate dehydrogenase complex dihydrolipoamide acyltransferase (E2) component
MSDFTIRPFPPERALVVDAGYLASGRHIIYGLAEVDVTRAREILRAREVAGEAQLSFTAFIVACLARAISTHPEVQAYRDWLGRLVIFRDVDVVTLIEPEPGAVAIPHIIRNADRRAIRDISEEIRRVKEEPRRSQQSGGLTSLAPRLPRFTRMLFFWLLKKDPHRFKRLAGTVVVTSIGMFASGGVWGITFLPTHNLGLTVGGICQKPGVHNGEIEIREFLSLTIAFDHDIIDGAPAARFGRTLVELIEQAEILESEAE